MIRDDDVLLKRLELYFDDQQADLAIFRATLQMTIMRREYILAELEDTLQQAQDLARKDLARKDLARKDLARKDLAHKDDERSLADLPAVKVDVPISPAGSDAYPSPGAASVESDQ
jgi:hypothetical protein